MAQIVLGVTGSVAALRTPALFAALRGMGHRVRVVATEPSLHFFDPASSPPTRPTRSAAPSSATPTSGPATAGGATTRSSTSSSADGPTSWSSPRSTPTPWPSSPSGLSDNFLTCLFRAWDFARPGRPGPGDEHPDVGQPGHPAPPPPAPRRPGRRPARRRLDPRRGRRRLRPPRPGPDPGPAPGQAARLRRRRPGGDGRGRRDRRGGPRDPGGWRAEPGPTPDRLAARCSGRSTPRSLGHPARQRAGSLRRVRP